MKKNGISHGELSTLCLELSMLLHAGVGTGDALSLLAEESDPEYKAMLMDMAKEVDGGAALSDAMRRAEGFPVYVCGLVEVGERAGRTEEALAALSRYYESRARLDRRVRSALLYPAVMLLLMLVVIAVLLVKVLPIFDDVYASLGGEPSHTGPLAGRRHAGAVGSAGPGGGVSGGLCRRALLPGEADRLLAQEPWRQGRGPEDERRPSGPGPGHGHGQRHAH